MLAQPVNNQTKSASAATSRSSTSSSNTELVDLTAEEDQSQEKTHQRPLRSDVVIPTGPLKSGVCFHGGVLVEMKGNNTLTRRMIETSTCDV